MEESQLVSEISGDVQTFENQEKDECTEEEKLSEKQEIYNVQLTETDDIDEFLTSLLHKSKEYTKIIIDANICMKDIYVLLELLHKVLCSRISKTIDADKGKSDPWPISWFLHLKLNMDYKFPLQKIPLEVWIVPQIERLCVSRLPSSQRNFISPLIGLQRNMSYIEIKCGSLQSIPDSIRYCSKIKEFHMVGNHLRALPGSLLDFTELEMLSRHDNSRMTLDWEIVDLQEEEGAGEKEEKKIYNPMSLLQLSLLEAGHNLLAGSRNPREVFPLLPFSTVIDMDVQLAKYRICSWCKKLFHGERGQEVYHSRENFRGYKYVAFGDPTCSASCTLKIEERNDEYKYFGEDTVTVYDLSPIPRRRGKVRKLFNCW